MVVVTVESPGRVGQGQTGDDNRELIGTSVSDDAAVADNVQDNQ